MSPFSATVKFTENSNFVVEYRYDGSPIVHNGQSFDPLSDERYQLAFFVLSEDDVLYSNVIRKSGTAILDVDNFGDPLSTVESCDVVCVEFILVDKLAESGKSRAIAFQGFNETVYEGKVVDILADFYFSEANGIEYDFDDES